jgi:hypothetical protein
MRGPVTLLLGFLLVASGALQAQAPARPHGAWLGAGIGVGSGRLSCKICVGDRESGTAGYLRAGVAVTRRFLLGAETLVWYSSGSVDQLIYAFQAIAFVYPSRRSGFYLKAGLGWARYAADDDDGGEVATRALAAQAGIGLEVPVARGVSLVPFANLMGTTGADLEVNDTVSDQSANTSLIQVGLGLTLH